jgi:hypothetical protein
MEIHISKMTEDISNPRTIMFGKLGLIFPKMSNFNVKIISTFFSNFLVKMMLSQCHVSKLKQTQKKVMKISHIYTVHEYSQTTISEKKLTSLDQ